MRARRRGLAAVLLAVTGGMAGLGPVLLATAQPAGAFQAEAQMIETDANQFAYNPNYIEIYVGDRVRWKNNTEVKHTVTSDPGSPAAFDSDEVPPTKGPDDGWEKRFNQVGTYNYRCKIHANMKGVVQVTDPRVTSTTATTAPPAPTTTTAPPPTTTTTTAPPTTTTSAPTTTTTLRPPAGLEPPPVPATAAAPPPLATSSTTTIPSSTTTTSAPPPTTVTSVPPSTSPEAALPGTSTSAPPSTEPPATGDTDDESTAAGPISRDGDADPATVALVAALVAVGLFGAWTLIRVRPGRV